MSISSSIGLVSGIDSGAIIQQLLALDAQAKTPIFQRIGGLNASNAALLDVNARLLAFKSASSTFRADDIFRSTNAMSSDEGVLLANARSSAIPGQYAFRVKQLVSTSQVMSGGFTSSTLEPLGLDSMSFEWGNGRLGREVLLEDLNGGAGVERGSIRIQDRSGNAAIVDLSLASSITEVIDAINDETGIAVTASLSGDRIVIEDGSGGTGNLSIQNAGGTTTATDLGIVANVASDVVAGNVVNRLDELTLLSTLNDDNGVLIRDNVVDFRIRVGGEGGTIHSIDLGRQDARIDGETLLADLNDGEGIRINETTGQPDFSIVTTDGTQVDITLGQILDDDGEVESEAVTNVQELLSRVNATLEEELGAGQVVMSIDADGEGFSLVDAMGGGGDLEVIGAGPFDAETAEDLGIFTGSGGGSGNSIEGDRLPNTVEIASASTIQDVIDRINEQTDGAVSASVGPDGVGIRLVAAGELVTVLDDGVGGDYGATTLEDLGFEIGVESTSLVGARVLGGMGTVLVDTINGGSGLGGASSITITDRNGESVTVDNLDVHSTMEELVTFINDAAELSGVAVNVGANAEGNGLAVFDSTGGNQNLVVTGDAATALGIEIDVVADTARGLNIQRQYVSAASDLATLNYGRGVGLGKFRITDGNGISAVVDIGNDSKKLFDVMNEINSRGLDVEARLNENGDGMILVDTSVGGSAKIKVESISGSTARDLGILGEATAIGASIDGSYERSVDLDVTDTLDEVIGKINDAGLAVAASLLDTNTGGSPLRLVLSSDISGLAGDLIVDTGGIDLGFNELTAARNAKVFIGEGAGGVLVESTSNVIDNIVAGVEIELQSASDSPVTVNVTRDETGIVDSVQAFVDGFNGVIEVINQYDSYDSESEIRGPLLGDPTVAKIKQDLYRILQQRAVGVDTQFNFLAEVGIRIAGEGQIEFDKGRFEEAYADDPEAVENLFAAYESTGTSTETIAPGVTVDNITTTYDELGFGDLFKQAIEKLTNSIDGTVTLASRNFDALIDAQKDRIEEIDQRLAAKELRLFREFTAMETTLARLQSQQSSLGMISQNLANAGALIG
ncbi:MAG: flagellar filament capping protein FliD [Planctomycetota bacterium]|jgi:flagellar hook-associated protein 2